MHYKLDKHSNTLQHRLVIFTEGGKLNFRCYKMDADLFVKDFLKKKKKKSKT